MKNLIIFAFFILALVAVQFTKAQTVDDIAKKNIDAMGGAEKLASLKSVKMEGNMSIQGNDISVAMTKAHMTGLRMDIEVMGTSNYQVANSTKGSVFMPVRGMTAPEDMEADQYKSSQVQMDIQGALFNYKEKGTTVEYIGLEDVEKSPAYKMKMTFKNGKVANYYYDVKTNRLVKTSAKTTVNGQEMDLESVFSDYKQTADGFWFPYTVASTQGTINYNKITTNIPIDESTFKN